MEDFYDMIGISKQGYYKRLSKQRALAIKSNSLFGLALDVRSDHPRMGCRKLYWKIKPDGLGRDKFEKILLANGFRLSRKRNYHRTTYAGSRTYSNLISGMQVVGVNRLWVSDITYLEVLGREKPYYLTLILDVYSQRVAGWSLSDNMTSQDTVVKAYKLALKGLRVNASKKLIFHSDRGSQYGSKIVERIHKSFGVNPSMGNKAWENGHAESINGVLKGEYISFRDSSISLAQATKKVEKWIYLYNY